MIAASAILVTALVSAAAAASSQLVWDEMRNTTAAIPAHRLGMTIATLSDAPGMLMFAGCSSSCCYDPLDDVWVWTPSNQLRGSQGGDVGSWKQLPTPSTAPPGRLFHSMTALHKFGSDKGTDMEQTMLVGGSSVAQGFLNDAWTIETTGLASGSATPIWSKVSPVSGPDGLPAGRGGHTTSLVESPLQAGMPALVVIGGRNLTAVLSDVWILASKSSSSSSSGGQIQWEWSQIQSPNAAAFDGLVSHNAQTVTLGPDGSAPTHIIIIGGTDGLGEDSDEILALDLKTYMWTNVTLSGDALGKRHGAVNWPVGAQPGTASFEVFGGQSGVNTGSPYLGDLLHFNLTLTAQGTIINAAVSRQQNGTTTPNGAQPDARVNAAVSLRPSGAGAVADAGAWLFGGFSGYNGGLDDQLHNDLWAVSTA